jgi:hypothetical protein
VLTEAVGVAQRGGTSSHASLHFSPTKNAQASVLEHSLFLINWESVIDEDQDDLPAPHSVTKLPCTAAKAVATPLCRIARSIGRHKRVSRQAIYSTIGRLSINSAQHLNC